MTKSKSSFKEDFQKHPVGFSLSFAGIFIAALVIIFMNVGSLSEIWPSSELINGKRLLLRQNQKKLQDALNELDILEKDRDSFIANNANFWISERDGDPKINMQKRISSLAADHEFTLSSVGAVGANKIVDGINLMTLTIRGDGKLKNLIDFLGELQDAQPRFYWQNILIKPKNPSDPDVVMLNGKIGVVAIDDKEITDLLLEK